MKKNPEQETQLVKTSVRLPPDVIAALKFAGKHNGRTMNAEILARVSEAEDRATFRQLVTQNEELRTLLREVLSRLDDLK